jgi:hypothetical protein
MTEYERTLGIDAPASAVFEYVSDVANVQKVLPETEGATFDIDPKDHTVSWSKGPMSGAIEVDSGDVTPEISEIILRLSFANRRPSDPPTKQDEEILERIDKALRQVHDHVKHAHSRKPKFL